MNNQTISKLTVLLVALFMLSISATTNAGKKTITLYHKDALGSIVAASDVEGNVIWRKTYDPYGNEVITTENGEEYEGQAYTGKPYDKETGLLYLGQRYYDPELKRFLSMDPVGFVASNPASFNRYAYANNNPYKFIDPDGRSALTAFGGVLHESYNFTQGRGFNGPMIMGALVDGYNGEGKGFGWSLFEDVTSFVPLGSAVKGYRLIKARFGNTPTQLAATNLATKGASSVLSRARPSELFGTQLKTEFTNSRIKTIKKLIKQNGIDSLPPIQVAIVNGRKIILDGHHTARAAGGLKLKDVPIQIQSVSPARAAQLQQQAAEAAHSLGLGSRF